MRNNLIMAGIALLAVSGSTQNGISGRHITADRIAPQPSTPQKPARGEQKRQGTSPSRFSLLA